VSKHRKHHRQAENTIQNSTQTGIVYDQLAKHNNVLIEDVSSAHFLSETYCCRDDICISLTHFPAINTDRDIRC